MSKRPYHRESGISACLIVSVVVIYSAEALRDVSPSTPVNLDRIRSLYHALTKSEVRYLKTYLKAFHVKGVNRALQLIEQLEKHPDWGNAEMAQRLYGDPRSKAFIMLKHRLAERMMETMTLSVNLQNNPTVKEDPAQMAIISMQKMLSHAILLRTRGLYEQARDQLQKALQLAREHGNPEIEVQCLAHLCNLATSLDEVHDLYRPHTMRALEAYRTDLIGLGIMTEYRLLGRADRLQEDESVAETLAEQALVLEDRIAHHYTLRGHMYLLMLRAQVHQLRNEYEACRKVVHERLNLFQAHPGLCSKYRMGAIYLQLSDVETRCLQFEEGAKAAEQARDCFLPSKPSYFKASIILLFASLYRGDLARVQAVIEELRQYEHLPHAQRMLPVVAYLEACWHYLSGDPRAALHLLMEDKVLTQDKSGWNVGQRIFEILILVEQGEVELADSKVETLRKHVARYGTDMRNELIFKVLYRSARACFEPTQLQARLAELQSELAGTQWVALSHEVIRFETWLTCLAQQVPYLPQMRAELAAARQARQGL